MADNQNNNEVQINNLQIQLEDIAQKMDYKLNKDILNKIKHKLNL